MSIRVINMSISVIKMAVGDNDDWRSTLDEQRVTDIRSSGPWPSISPEKTIWIVIQKKCSQIIIERLSKD